MASTWRATAKADRRQRYLDAAAQLFAVRGYVGVSIEELGAAAGVSGPALYRHFRGKEDVLAELLVTASERLLDGATEAVGRGAGPAVTLTDLVAFHADFALAERDVIRVQDRELVHLPEEASRRVRSLQRRYVETWADVLVGVRPDLPRSEAVVRLHAVFGLLNATPTTPGLEGMPDPVGLLTAMALAALLAPVSPAAATPAAG
ncbi:MAG TPA: TetR/AcrR family transcriptional regulator [Amnibacterium sp.]|nr:TetR/AcrR family transcriptional regulator [Amnibacterium sp.]